MLCRRFAQVAVVATAVAATTLIASAQQVLPGTYASWTDAQKTQAAGLLKDGSSRACAQYTDSLKNDGGQRAAYEAATCIGAYYVNHLPPDYPGLDAIKKSVMQNYANAKALGSNVPVPFVPSPSPSPRSH